MPGGVFIPKIEQINSAETWEEAKPLLLEALRDIAGRLSQGDIVVSEGNPERELRADAGTMIVLDRLNGKLYFKATGVANKTGWKEIAFV